MGRTYKKSKSDYEDNYKPSKQQKTKTLTFSTRKRRKKYSKRDVMDYTILKGNFYE